MRTHFALFAAGLAATGMTVLLVAASAGAAQPDPAAGKVESVICATCHGSDGISVATDVPNLAGQHYEYLVQQLIAFKGGTRRSGVMNEMVRPMSLAQLRNVAAYYSTVPITVSATKAKN
jgi:cytochrome c553